MLVREILTIIRRWLWFLALAAIAGGVISYASALSGKAIYETSAGVVVVRQGIEINLEPRFSATTGDATLFDVRGNGLDTLASLVPNDAIAEEVFITLRDELGGFEEEPARLTGMISGDVRNGIIQVTARSSDPALARKLANAWAAAYADYVNRIYAGQLVTTELNSQIAEARQRYEEAEAALVAFTKEDRRDQLQRLVEEKQAVLARLIALHTDRLAGELETLSQRRNQTEQLLQNALILQNLLANSESPPSNAANSLALLYLQYRFVNGESVVRQETTAEGGQVLITPQEPGQQLRFVFQPQRLDEITSSPDTLRSDLDRLVDALNNQLSQYDREIERLREEASSKAFSSDDPIVQDLFTQIQDLNAQIESLSARSQELTQERDLLWESYTLLAKGSQETTLTAAASSDTLVRFAIPAPFPSRPIRSASAQSAILGAFTGLILALAIVFGFELLDDKVRTREDIEQVLELPVLAQAPRQRGSKGRVAALTEPHAPLVDAVRLLRARLLGHPRKPHSLLITSWLQGEGKSAIAANLAVVTALSGRRVLLIDANLRTPVLHELFGTDNGSGFNQLLHEPSVELNGYLQTTDVPGLVILPAGPREELASDMLASERMQSILDAARRYDLVIFDTPAVGMNADALALAPRVDATLFVVRAGTTSLTELEVLRRRLQSAGGDIVGAILNRVSPPGGLWGTIRSALQTRVA